MVFKRFSSVLLVLLVHPVAAHVLFQLAKQRDETLQQEGVRSCKLGECVTRLDDRADIEDCVRKTCEAERQAISKMPYYQAEKAAIMAADGRVAPSATDFGETAGKASSSEGPPAKKHKSEDESSSRGGDVLITAESQAQTNADRMVHG